MRHNMKIWQKFCQASLKQRHYVSAHLIGLWIWGHRDHDRLQFLHVPVSFVHDFLPCGVGGSPCPPLLIHTLGPLGGGDLPVTGVYTNSTIGIQNLQTLTGLSYWIITNTCIYFNLYVYVWTWFSSKCWFFSKASINTCLYKNIWICIGILVGSF